jgi:HTH-type transcriptional regulator / antitoxin HigA
MLDSADFKPQWFSAPGATIAHRLKATNTNIIDFAWEMDFTESEAEDLIEGRMPITDPIAERLQVSLGVSATFWRVRDAQYRNDVLRLAQEITQDSGKNWLRELPVRDMVSFGWISDQPDLNGKVAECLRYFDIPTLEMWDERMAMLLATAKLRTSQTLKSNPGALAAWLRRGEIEANQIQCQGWNADRFREQLGSIRQLSWQKDPKTFIPQLRDACAKVGVALVIAKAPDGCRASGATKFVSESKAMLMLSFRYLSDDHFWFSFFHEAGHLILHGKDQTFFEGEPHELCGYEQEADAFAERMVIPDQYRDEYNRLTVNKISILKFATKIGICPGIVVGQLQHSGRLKHNYLNYLKRRYSW